jgi:hypothetical protein
MRNLTLIFLIFLIQSAQAQQQDFSLQATILFEPNIVPIDKVPFVYYEIHCKNFSSDKITLISLRIQQNTTSVFELEGESLLNQFYVPDAIGKNIKCDIPAGQSGVLYLEYALPAKGKGELKHSIVFEKHTNKDLTETIHTFTIPYPKKSNLVVGAPVQAGKWAAVYEPSWERGHRRVFYTTDDQARLPGRFAIDFIKLDDQGFYASGNQDSIKNWFGYGTNIIAVADGIIVAVDTSYTESQSIDNHKPYPFDQATGNYIAMDIGGQYAFYEHLKPKSIKVKVGDKIKKGTVLASLGFTGNTTGPHLHFHIADKNSPLGAESVPFMFEAYTYLGGYKNFSDFGVKRWNPTNSNKASRKRDRPAPNSILEFN